MTNKSGGADGCIPYPYEVHQETPCRECGCYSAFVDGNGEIEHLDCRRCGQRLSTYRISWPSKDARK